MDWTADPTYEIGLAAYRNGKPLTSEGFDAAVRRITKISFQDGAAQFMLPDTIHAIRPRVARGQVVVHRTNDEIDAACGFEYLDVAAGRYESGIKAYYRLVDVRGLVVAAEARRIGIGWRLVRQICLMAMVHSPLERGEYGSALRSMCCVAAIDPENVPALELAQSMGALIDTVEGPAVNSHLAFRAYALTCVESARLSGKREPMIAIFRNIDLIEASMLVLSGVEGQGTTEFGSRIDVSYDRWWSPTSEFSSVIKNLASHGVSGGSDLVTLKRFGLEDSIHTQGMGNVFWGAVTADMSYSVSEN